MQLPDNCKEVIRRLRFKDHQMIQGIALAGMYYLYVAVQGIPNPDVPCCCFRELTVACAINHFPVYNLMLKIINAYEDRCMIAEDQLLDLYLKKKLITDAVELSDYTTANKIFKDIYDRELTRGNCLNACRVPVIGLDTDRSKDTVRSGSVRNGCQTCG